MTKTHVGHSDLVAFADERVNLKRDDAKELREQVWRLRDRLEGYLEEHPDFELKKMLLSGSLAKGTALKSLNDIDVAVYVSSEKAPSSVGELINWLAERLRTIPNIKPEQVKTNKFSVTITFSGTGLKVDVVPILYAGDPDWKGHLISRDNGEKILTSIPMHLDFIGRRKKANEKHFAQLVRLVKFWICTRRAEDDNFRFKSFMAELFIAQIADSGADLSDYPDALERIFTRIATDGFQTAVCFDDNYDPATCPTVTHPIRIWDPVNHENNVANLYTTAQRDTIIDAALEAGDALDAAFRAPTKGETVRYWRKIFGPSFEA